MRPVPEHDPKSWLLKALRETANALESLLWGIDEELVAGRPDEDEWSSAELMRHMAEMERCYVDRLERMVTLDEPHIRAFDADSLEDARRPRRPDAFDALEEFAELRRQAVYLLWSLERSDWHRKGIHPYLGPLTILQVAREMNEHDLAHLWQMRRLADHFAAASV